MMSVAENVCVLHGEQEGEKVGAWAADHSRQQEVLQQSLDLLTSQVKQLQSTATQVSDCYAAAM
jgi:predicted RecB family nuclease